MSTWLLKVQENIVKRFESYKNKCVTKVTSLIISRISEFLSLKICWTNFNHLGWFFFTITISCVIDRCWIISLDNPKCTNSNRSNTRESGLGLCFWQSICGCLCSEMVNKDFYFQVPENITSSFSATSQREHGFMKSGSESIKVINSMKNYSLRQPNKPVITLRNKR